MLKLVLIAAALTPAVTSAQVFEVVTDRDTVDLDVGGQNTALVSVYLDVEGNVDQPWDQFRAWSFFSGFLAGDGGTFVSPPESASNTSGADWIGRRPPATLPGPGGANGGFRYAPMVYTVTDGEASQVTEVSEFDTVLHGYYPGYPVEGIQASTALGGFNQDTSQRLEVFRAELVFDKPGVHTVRFHPVDGAFFNESTLTVSLLGVQSWMTAIDTTVVANSVRPYIESITGNRDPVVHGKRLKITANGVLDAQGDEARVRYFRDSNHNGRLDNRDEFLGRDANGANGWMLSALSDSSWGTAPTLFFAQAVDRLGNRSDTVSLMADVLAPGVPKCRSLWAAVNWNMDLQMRVLRLRARGVSDDDGSIELVRFFHDTNPDGTLGAGDVKIGVVRNPTTPGVPVVLPLQPEWGTGVVRFHTQAVDNDGNKSLPKSVDIELPAPSRSPMLAGCPADRDADGWVGAADLTDFLNAYADRDPTADTNADGFVDPTDLAEFVQLWYAGCE